MAPRHEPMVIVEAVGKNASAQGHPWIMAIQAAHPGVAIGYVGVPHGVLAEGLNVTGMFFKQITYTWRKRTRTRL